MAHCVLADTSLIHYWEHRILDVDVRPEGRMGPTRAINQRTDNAGKSRTKWLHRHLTDSFTLFKAVPSMKNIGFDLKYCFFVFNESLQLVGAVCGIAAFQTGKQCRSRH